MKLLINITKSHTHIFLLFVIINFPACTLRHWRRATITLPTTNRELRMEDYRKNCNDHKIMYSIM